MKRGPYNRTATRKAAYARAVALRRNGYGYRMIAKEVGLSWNTIRNWVRDIAAPNAKQKFLEHKRASRSIVQGKGAVRLWLIELRGHQCESCKRRVWKGNPIPLEMHRLVAGGEYSEANVQLLCANCHSLTDTFRNKKRKP